MSCLQEHIAKVGSLVLACVRDCQREAQLGAQQMPTSSMNSTPGTSSAVPWSMYLLTTCRTAACFTHQRAEWQPECSQLAARVMLASRHRGRGQRLAACSGTRLVTHQRCSEQPRAVGRTGSTLLISCRSLSVISVFLGFSIWPMTAMMSCPPAGLAFAASRSCSVTSCVSHAKLLRNRAAQSL